MSHKLCPISHNIQYTIAYRTLNMVCWILDMGYGIKNIKIHLNKKILPGGGGGGGGITVGNDELSLSRSNSMSILSGAWPRGGVAEFSTNMAPKSPKLAKGGLDSWLEVAWGVLGWLNSPVSIGVPVKN